MKTGFEEAEKRWMNACTQMNILHKILLDPDVGEIHEVDILCMKLDD